MYFLNQKFQVKYLLVTFISFIGIFIMIIGAEKSQPDEVGSSYVKNTFLGIVAVGAFVFSIIISYLIQNIF